jgi:hypothetical protein
MKAQILSIGLTAPGLVSFQSFKQILQEKKAFDPSLPIEKYSPSFLPSNERRRVTPTIKIALKTAEEALSHFQKTFPNEAINFPVLFVSKDGDPQVAAKMCQAVSENPPLISPIQFHNSVHNAPAGYWMIGQSNQAAANAISAGEYAVANGLLEAVLQSQSENKPILVVIYDLPLDDLMPVESLKKSYPPFAFSMILDASQTRASSDFPALSLSLEDIKKHHSMVEKNPYTGVPSAEGYALLKAVAEHGVKSLEKPISFPLNSHSVINVSLVDG